MTLHEMLPRFAEPPATGALREALDEAGCAVIENVVSDNRMDGLVREVACPLDEQPVGTNDFLGRRTRRLFSLFARTRYFDDLVTSPPLATVANDLLGPCQLNATVAISVGPGEVAQTHHRDRDIYPNRAGSGPLVLSTLWALDDFTPENGATVLIPGSHRWVEQRPDESTPTVSAAMPSGSVLVYDGRLWHGAGANTTERPRRGVVIGFIPKWLRQQEMHLLSVPRATAATLAPEIQDLLGYNQFPPFLGYVDGLHPRSVLDESVNTATTPALGSGSLG